MAKYIHSIRCDKMRECSILTFQVWAWVWTTVPLIIITQCQTDIYLRSSWCPTRNEVISDLLMTCQHSPHLHMYSNYDIADSQCDQTKRVSHQHMSVLDASNTALDGVSSLWWEPLSPERLIQLFVIIQKKWDILLQTCHHGDFVLPRW